MNKTFFKKNNILFLSVIAAVLVIGAILIICAQTIGVKADFEKESVKFVQNVSDSIKNREHDLNALDEYNKTVSDDLIYNITWLYEDLDFPHLTDRERREYSPSNMCKLEKSNLESLYICGGDGKIWICDDESLLLKNIVDEGIITAADLAFFNADGGDGTYKLRYDEAGKPYRSFEPVAGYYKGHKVRYYAVKVHGKNRKEIYYAVGADRCELEKEITRAYSDLGAYFDTIVNYDGFSAFAVNTDTGIIEYASRYDSELKGRLASDVGIGDISAYDDGQFHKININGQTRNIYVRCTDAGVVGRYAVAAADIRVDGPLRSAAAVCIALVIIITAILIRTGFKLAGERRKYLIKEYTACVITCVVLAGLVSTYFSTISSISQAMEQSKVNAEAFAGYYRSGRDNAARISEFYKAKKVAVLKSIAVYLEHNKDQLTYGDDPEIYAYSVRDEKGNTKNITDVNGNATRSTANNLGLGIIAEDEAYKELYIINSRGNTVFTNTANWYYNINDGKSGFDGELNAVLERKQKYFYSYIDDENTGYEIIAVPYEIYISDDGKGNSIYHNYEEYREDITGSIRSEYGLLVATSSATSGLRLSMESIPREMLNSMRAAQDVELAVTEKTDDGRRIALRTEGIRDEDLTVMAIPDSYYLTDNYKFLDLGDINRLVGVSCLSGMSEMNMITVMKTADIQIRRWHIVIASMIAVLLVGIALIAYFTRLYSIEEETAEVAGSDSYHELEENDAVGSKWTKGVTAAGLVLLLAVLCLIVILNGSGQLRFMQYMVSVRWQRGVHIFSVSYFVHLIILVLLVITIAREFVHLLAPVFNSAVETMLRLLLSLVQYGSIVACIFYAMHLFGMQMGTLVTSAGILTAVVGFGAKSLIQDILAGLFIIFEHEYQVGNWVTIEDFTGVVRAIGLRTTKVENVYGNVKIINNSDIRSVMNLTDNYTAVFFYVSISNDIPVSRVNELVVNSLRRRTRFCREIKEGPMPGQIGEKPGYASGYYSYKVKARCEQKDVSVVKNILFAEFIEILKEEHIPFL